MQQMVWGSCGTLTLITHLQVAELSAHSFFHRILQTSQLTWPVACQWWWLYFPFKSLQIQHNVALCSQWRTGIAEQVLFNHCCLITDSLNTTALQYFCCHVKIQFLLVFFPQVKIFSMENACSFGKSLEKFTVLLSQRGGPATAEQKAVHVDLCIEGSTNQYIN